MDEQQVGAHDVIAELKRQIAEMAQEIAVLRVQLTRKNTDARESE